MAGYYSGTIKEGSNNNDVKKWQEFLQSQGYNIKIDGIFGGETKGFTRHYQEANGLTVDGIVGPETWGKAGFSNVNTPTATPTISAAPTLPTFNNTNYIDTTEGIAKKEALDKASGNFTNFGENWAYKDDYNTLLADYLGRDPFSYDFNGDALYQQYKDKYIQQGKLAMQDTMGQASAMTGGYGSSYSQSAGQQAYQNSLDNLNDIVPELYQMAYDRYNQKGQDMLNQLGVLDSDYTRGYNAAKDAYGVANDDYYNSESSYNANRTTANDLAQADYENKFNAWDVGNTNEWKEWEAKEGTRRWEAENELKKNSSVATGDNSEGKGKVVGKTANNNGSYTYTIAPDDGTTGYYETVIEPGYAYKETKNTQLFQASIKTKNEFYTRGGSDKSTYGTYENYIEGILDKWLGQGKLTEDEVATLLAHYGLA